MVLAFLIFFGTVIALVSVVAFVKGLLSPGRRPASAPLGLPPRVPGHPSGVLILEQHSQLTQDYDPSAASQPSDSPQDQSCCQAQDSSPTDSGLSCSSNDTSSDSGSGSSSPCDCASSDSGSSSCTSSDSSN